MIPSLSLLDTASAMARHAGHVHAVVADNIARADLPGATATEATRFGEALRDLSDGTPLRAEATRAPITLDEQMMAMAQNTGRHDAATLLFSKTLDLVRLAGSSPR